MSGSHRFSGPGFMPGQAADAMWQAMEQMRAGFDKRAGSRMGRGDVRASILALLAEEPMHGYQIIREIEERTAGKWKPSAGSVYPTLQLLADEGLVSAATAHDRKTYSLTDAGRQEAAKVTSKAPWAAAESHHHSGSAMGPLSKSGFDLAQAVAQVARSGSRAQQDKAVEALDHARRTIYSILAQD